MPTVSHHVRSASRRLAFHMSRHFAPLTARSHNPVAQAEDRPGDRRRGGVVETLRASSRSCWSAVRSQRSHGNRLIASGVAAIVVLGAASAVIGCGGSPPASAGAAPSIKPAGGAFHVSVDAHGRRYMCPASLIPDLDRLRARINAERDSVHRSERRLRALLREYPHGGPAQVVSRYNHLRRAHNARVRLLNAHVDGYNHRLANDCRPD
jgi:hypothetical protein